MRRHTALGSCAAAAILLAGCTQDRPTGIRPSDLDSGPSFAAAPAAEKIPGQYIVRLRDDVQDVGGVAVQIAGADGGTIGYLYSHAIKGFSIRISDAAAAGIARHSKVLHVEQDQVVHAIADQQGATWGIDRVDQPNLPVSGTYGYNATGAGVKVYIIDTGIRLTHNEFGGRAIAGTDKIDNDDNPDDCNGHGTHVAGTVGGTTYGVAKAATLVAVRVLDCGGSGSNSAVIAGIDWATADHQAGQPAAANMSLGGVGSALNAAVQGSIADGITYAIAAGNSNFDACFFTPASAPNAITVAASTRSVDGLQDQKAGYSNYGSCVDIYAPGSGITSAWNAADDATETISGTSMASPHVAGAAALYLQSDPSATPAKVAQELTGKATVGKIVNNVGATPNKLLYTFFITATPPTKPAAPTSLAASAVNSSRIDLAWTDNSNNEDAFAIERCTGAECTNFAEHAVVGANVASYSDAGLAGSTTYRYQVRARNGAGDSEYSNVAAATTAAPPVAPAAPTGLTATAAGQTQINLAWTDNSNNEDRFKIERCTGAGCSNFAQIATVGPNVTTYDNTGLSPGTSYSYRVLANNGGGDSPYSNLASATTDSPPPNIAPTAKYTWRCGGTNGTDGRTCDFDGSTSTSGEASDNNGKVTSYFWNFGDQGATSSAEKPRRRFSKNGTFSVNLRVTDKFGLTDTAVCNVTTGRGATGSCQ
jgi:subtilisin family serine protease